VFTEEAPILSERSRRVTFSTSPKMDEDASTCSTATLSNSDGEDEEGFIAALDFIDFCAFDTDLKSPNDDVKASIFAERKYELNRTEFSCCVNDTSSGLSRARIS